MGIAKCRSRSLYWPKMNGDNHKMVSNCDKCQLYQCKQRKEPLHQHDVPATPWMKIGKDLFTLNGSEYLIVVDYTSNFPESNNLCGITSKHVIDALKSIMARFGILVFGNNAPQFSSAEFLSSTKFYNF